MNEASLVPTSWCNLLHDYPELYKEILAAGAPAEFKKNSSTALLKQPLSLMRQSHDTVNPDIMIPSEVRELYLTYRPTPFRRAYQLEKALQTKTEIYYKFEGANASGSHKLNTAIAQAYYFKKAGIKHVITSTGAGQWGTAMAYACRLFGLACTVFMVNISLQQKPQRKAIMELYGAKVHASPSNLTKIGQDALAQAQFEHGSLAIATGEAIELVQSVPGAKFAVGSGETNVLLHQSIIGNEAIKQMEVLGIFPQRVYACVGAGSNFCGMVFPLLRYAKKQHKQCDFIAVEPRACPKLTQGVYRIDKNDFSGTTPYSKMYTLGADYISPPIHAGGLRYHGTSEFLSSLYYHQHVKACVVSEKHSLAAGLLFFEKEGILPAPESAYAIAAAIHDIENKPEEAATIAINISGHGLFDIRAYEEYQQGILQDDKPSFSPCKISEMSEMI